MFACGSARPFRTNLTAVCSDEILDCGSEAVWTGLARIECSSSSQALIDSVKQVPPLSVACINGMQIGVTWDSATVWQFRLHLLMHKHAGACQNCDQPCHCHAAEPSQCQISRGKTKSQALVPLACGTIPCAHKHNEPKTKQPSFGRVGSVMLCRKQPIEIKTAAEAAPRLHGVFWRLATATPKNRSCGFVSEGSRASQGQHVQQTPLLLPSRRSAD